ncbi:hypothetical protein EPO05_05030 [Patescibacteria group bacterium]|nr:MAG: hypothetical protein EPO05_05030 [Patescibacteria group bacterium]
MKRLTKNQRRALQRVLAGNSASRHPWETYTERNLRKKGLLSWMSTDRAERALVVTQRNQKRKRRKK